MKKGFTLIELLVVLAVFSVLAVISSTILISFFRSENKIVATNDVRQRGNRIIDVFERDVRAAQDAVVGTCNTNDCTITLIAVEDFGSDVIWRCRTSGSVRILSRQRTSVRLPSGVIGPEIPVDFTENSTNGTTVSSNCDIFNVSGGTPKLVKLVFSLANGVGTSGVEVPFQTSISARKY